MHWLLGFWATWIGLIAPACVALVKHSRDSSTSNRLELQLAGPSPFKPALPSSEQRVLLPAGDVKRAHDSLEYTYEAPGQPLCPQCGLRPALFYCRSHHAPLCLTCVGSHDVVAECIYVPGWRPEAAFAGEAHEPTAVYEYEAPGLPMCPNCRRLPALFYCSAHHLSVCLTCICTHDAAPECFYAPGWRASKQSAPSPQGGGSPRAASKPKKGDIFGIS